MIRLSPVPLLLRGAFTLLLLGTLVACSKGEAEKLHEQYGERAAQTVAMLEHLGASTLPAVTVSDAWRTLDFERDRAILYYHSALADLQGEASPLNPYERPFGLSSVINFARTGEIDERWLESARDSVVSSLVQLAEPSAIVVIEPLDVQVGEVVYDTADQAVGYRAGHMQAAAHFFSSTGDALGGFTFEASNPAELNFRATEFGIRNGRQTLEGNLYRCAWQSFYHRLAEHFPDAGITIGEICAIRFG